HRNGLAAEYDLVVIERPEGFSVRRDIILVGVAACGHARAVLVREKPENAIHAQGVTRVESDDAAARDGRGDDAAMGEIGGGELGGIFRRPGDFRAAIHAGGGSADRAGHGGAHAIFLWDCDCGVLRAAWVSARTMARRASGILKALCA